MTTVAWKVEEVCSKVIWDMQRLLVLHWYTSVTIWEYCTNGTLKGIY